MVDFTFTFTCINLKYLGMILPIDAESAIECQQTSVQTKDEISLHFALGILISIIAVI